MHASGEPQGDSPLARWMRKLYRDVQECRVTSVIGGRFNRGASGTQIIIPSFYGVGNYTIAEHFKIITGGLGGVHNDYLLCDKMLEDGVTYDTNGGNHYRVLKPIRLRTSLTPDDGLHGESSEQPYGAPAITTFTYETADPVFKYQRRIATTGTATETQVVVKSYTEGEIILAKLTRQSFACSDGVVITAGTAYVEDSSREWCIPRSTQQVLGLS